MSSLIYPLKQVLEVKEKRVDDAEKVVKEKQEALKKEQETLAQKEAERDKVKNHHQDKLAQLRHSLDEEMTTTKIQQMKAYLKVVKEKLAGEEKKVSEQKKQVQIAEKNLETAQAELKQKRLEVDKLYTHRKDWLKEVKKELEVIAGREEDELGSQIFTSKHFKK